MRILGVFVGVDAQDDEDLALLPFAAEDARALWALCGDWNEAGGGENEDCVLLTGQSATRNGVLAALRAAVDRSARAQFDLALVHFAGHGTAAGTVLGSDASLTDPLTGVSLDEIGTLVAQMDAAHTVMAFDACFSGQAGLLAPGRAHQDATLGDRLRALATDRRAVVWACGPDERAWESGRLRHGLLTYGLVSALERPEHLDAGERISLSRWIEHAVRVTHAEANQEGRVQTPGFAMLWQASASVSRPMLGPRRAAMLQERDIFAVGPDLRDLARYGFEPQWIDAVSSRIGGGSLTDLQQRAIAPHGVLAGRNLVVSAPTSTGKTLIGELAILENHRRGRRALYLTPLRALAQEKYDEFTLAYAHLGLRVVRAYGGINDEDAALNQGRFDVAFMTYEKCFGQVMSRASFVDPVGVVVLDEAHLLADRDRGRVAELLLMALKARRARGQDLQLVLLSAVMHDLGRLEQWLDAEVAQAGARPVQLDIGVVTPDGRYRYRSFAPNLPAPVDREIDLLPPLYRGTPKVAGADVEESLAIGIVKKRLAEDAQAQVLLFRSQRPAVYRLARILGEDCGLPACDAAADEHSERIRRDASRASEQLEERLRQGIGIHAADLDLRERSLVERSIRARALRVTVATTTLAMGINTPATDVIIVDSTRYDGVGQSPLPVSEVQNMAGRAGRWIGGAEIGSAYLVASSQAQAQELWNRYIDSPPLTLQSQLGEMAREDLVLALIATCGADSPESLVDGALTSFDGLQRGDDPEWRQRLRADLREATATLLEHGFLSRRTDGALVMTLLGHVCVRDGFRVSSAISVLAAADALQGAGEVLDSTALLALAQVTEELDAVYTGIAKRGEPAWVSQLQSVFPDRLALLTSLETGTPERLMVRAKRLCCTLAWLQGIEVARIEQEFGRYMQGPSHVHVGQIRQITERTSQIVRPIAAILATLFPRYAEQLQRTLRTLRPRLELGVPADAQELTQCRLGLTRDEIFGLRDAGVITTAALGNGLLQNSEALAEIFRGSRFEELRSKTQRVGVQGLQRAQEREAALQCELFDGLTLRDLAAPAAESPEIS